MCRKMPTSEASCWRLMDEVLHGLMTSQAATGRKDASGCSQHIAYLNMYLSSILNNADVVITKVRFAMSEGQRFQSRSGGWSGPSTDHSPQSELHKTLRQDLDVAFA